MKCHETREECACPPTAEALACPAAKEGILAREGRSDGGRSGAGGRGGTRPDGASEVVAVPQEGPPRRADRGGAAARTPSGGWRRPRCRRLTAPLRRSAFPAEVNPGRLPGQGITVGQVAAGAVRPVRLQVGTGGRRVGEG